MMGIGFSSLEDKAGARRSTCASVPQILNLLELLPGTTSPLQSPPLENFGDGPRLCAAQHLCNASRLG